MDDLYQLARLARRGNRNALSLLVDTSRSQLFSAALSITQNFSDAQDAVADAVVEICLHIEDLQNPNGVRAWMSRIVKREALRIRRKPPAAPLMVDAPDPRPYSMHSVMRLDVEQALHQLPANQTAAIQRFYFDELSVREIADAMSTADDQVNLAQVKTWLYRGRQQLAGSLKGYDEMKTTTPKPLPRRAAIFCSDLAVDTMTAVTQAMRDGGYEPIVIDRKSIPGFNSDGPNGQSVWSKEHIAQSTALTELIKGFDAVVFDEHIDNRSGLEFSLFCKSTADTVRIPITLLYSPPADAIFISACATVGIAHLVDKADIGSIKAVFKPREDTNIWRHFSEEAKQVIYHAQDEAKRLHENFLSTEHLLLGLIHDEHCPGAVILDTQLGTSIEAVRAELAKHLVDGPGFNEARDMQLTPRCKRVIDYGVEEASEAGSPEVGSEHLLLGLIGEYEGLAGKVLSMLKVTVEDARRIVTKRRP